MRLKQNHLSLRKHSLMTITIFFRVKKELFPILSPKFVMKSVCRLSTNPMAGPMRNQVWKIPMYTGELLRLTLSSRKVVPNVTRGASLKTCSNCQLILILTMTLN